MLLLLVALVATPAAAGPPYDTDDPAPTDRGHWEIYAFAAGEGLGRTFDGAAGLDLNYGPVDDVQLTATLPVEISRDARTSLRGGDVEIGAKVRLVEREGFALAVFPRAILPTGRSNAVGGLLPIWVQQDFGKWSLFGGGGYAINPGAGNRDHWFGAAALTRQMSDRLSLGIEATRSGREADDTSPVTTMGIGGIRKLSEHLALLASAGPTVEDNGGAWRYHAYLALGVTF